MTQRLDTYIADEMECAHEIATVYGVEQTVVMIRMGSRAERGGGYRYHTTAPLTLEEYQRRGWDPIVTMLPAHYWAGRKAKPVAAGKIFAAFFVL